MKRTEALEKLAEDAPGILNITELGDGWPALGTVTISSGPLPVAVYAGVIGGSQRGRNDEERRFQNPAGDRPIEYFPDRLPLLIGLWPGAENEPHVLAGFDPTTRFGKRTRQSFFVPLTLLTLAQQLGWQSHCTGSGETLVAFRIDELPRYCAFRLGPDRQPLSDHRADNPPPEAPGTMSTEFLEALSRLLGCESLDALAHAIGTELAAATPATEADLPRLLEQLARREMVWRADSEELGPLDALAALAPLADC